MFKLLRSRKAQIRGIDFSLAIIIFSLTMGQILLLTDTFIDGNRSHIDFQERQEFADSTANQFVFNTGYGQGTENWAALPTDILLVDNWNLGLTTLGSIDPFKQSRLSNRSISDYFIDYDTARIGMNISSEYQIQILNPINVIITSLSDNAVDTINVLGTVAKASKPLFNAEIWVFIVNSIGTVVQDYTTSNSNGEFSLSLTVGGSDEFYTVVAIARIGLHSEDAAIAPYNMGNPPIIPTYGNISLFEKGGFGYTVNVTAEFQTGIDGGLLVALYPGLITGSANNTNLIMDDKVGTNYVNASIQVPPTNTVVFIAIGTQGGTFTSLAYVNFPVTLDDEISNYLEPLKAKSSTSSSHLVSIMTRDLLMDVILTVWDL